MMKIIDIKRSEWYTPGPNTRKLNSIRLRVIKQMNKFVEKVTMTDNGLTLGLYVKNCDWKEGVNGLFAKEDITGMFDTYYLNIIDMISLFLDAFMYHVND